MSKSLLSKQWPTLTSYDQSHLTCISMPLGGIGTGTVGLGGRGDLRDWEIMNRPSKGFVPAHTFFTLYAKPTGGQAVTKVLEGPLDPPYDSENGFRQRPYGLPRFRKCEFHAAYPFGQVLLSDPNVPLDVRIEAFNPLVPADADASGMPVAILRFVLTNRRSRRITASVCGNVQNFIGTDGVDGESKNNVNTFRRAQQLRGVFMSSRGVSTKAPQHGTMALTTTARAGVTYRTAWTSDAPGPVFTARRDFWNDFGADGKLENRSAAGQNAPVASLAVRTSVPPRGSRAITFLLTWRFPNRLAWGIREPKSKTDDAIVGNYYATQYRDAWDVALKAARKLPDLERKTSAFVRAFCESDLPPVVKEAALYNVSNLRSETCFRTRDGRFFGFEGCNDTVGCCLGSCSHVWNYEQATAFLFGDLSCKMREVEFLQATRDDGFMSFRVMLPVKRAREMDCIAADGQMGCLMKLYRDWRLSGNSKMLRRMWPRARKALEFAWAPGGWDADRDGVMEGRQHNTTDYDFYGPNPLTAGWYLGALRAAEEMAAHVGDDDFVMECRALFARGSAWVDKHLFNGEYYEQQVRSPSDHTRRLRRGEREPDNQPGRGCMTDQLVGQFLANVCGLGHLLRPGNIRTTLGSIMKHNFLKDMSDHVNPLRAFVLNNEKMLVYGTFPRGGRKPQSCLRFDETWTGIEYAAAVLMMQEGRVADGLRIFKAVRDRFDGRKRNPFDEPECGRHYARAMSSWAAVPALTGFHYSGVDRTMTFAAKEGKHFWSTGYAWGTCTVRNTRGGRKVSLKVLHGVINVERIILTGRGAVSLRRRRRLASGHSASFLVRGTGPSP